VFPESLRFCARLKAVHCENNLIELVPPVVLIECKSLDTLALTGNPIDIGTFEEMEGYKEFEKRRRNKASKAISSQVMLGDGTLEEAINRRT